MIFPPAERQKPDPPAAAPLRLTLLPDFNLEVGFLFFAFCFWLNLTW
jgi:hypothetical protein